MQSPGEPEKYGSSRLILGEKFEGAIFMVRLDHRTTACSHPHQRSLTVFHKVYPVLLFRRADRSELQNHLIAHSVGGYYSPGSICASAVGKEATSYVAQHRMDAQSIAATD